MKLVSSSSSDLLLLWKWRLECQWLSVYTAFSMFFTCLQGILNWSNFIGLILMWIYACKASVLCLCSRVCRLTTKISYRLHACCVTKLVDNSKLASGDNFVTEVHELILCCLNMGRGNFESFFCSFYDFCTDTSVMIFFAITEEVILILVYFVSIDYYDPQHKGYCWKFTCIGFNL